MRAGFGEMPQLFAVPTLGLPTLNDHRHNLTLIVESMGYCHEPPSVQAHGENVITVCCPVYRLCLYNLFYISISASVCGQYLFVQLDRDIAHGDFDFSFSHVLWLQPEVFQCDVSSGQLRC